MKESIILRDAVCLQRGLKSLPNSWGWIVFTGRHKRAAGGLMKDITPSQWEKESTGIHAQAKWCAGTVNRKGCVVLTGTSFPGDRKMWEMPAFPIFLQKR